MRTLISWIHPAWRLVGMIVLALAIVWGRGEVSLSFAAAGGLLLVSLVRPAGWWRRLVVLVGLLSGFVGLVALSSQGSWQEALPMAVKAVSVFCWGQGLLGTLSSTELVVGLQQLGLPDQLVMMQVLMIRYVEVLRQEFERLRTSMRLRGFRPRCNLHSLRSIGYLVGMVVWRALLRAERVMWAMKCRGFAGRFPAIALPRRWWADLAFAAGVLIWVSGIVCLRSW